jgi:thioredoxin reductase (NADPH)
VRAVTDTAHSNAPARSAILLVVDPDAASLARIRDELSRRYGHDYQVVCVDAPDEARSRLEEWRATHEPVAIVLTAQWMEGTTGTELLELVSELYPTTKRGLLIDFGDWGDAETASAIRHAMAVGHLDYYVLRPLPGHDELFHRTITEFLHEWSRAASGEPRQVVLLAEQWDRRGHELRSLLTRNGVPHLFYDSTEAAGADLLRALELGDETRPVIVLLDGRVLVDPSNAEVARAYGMTTELTDRRSYDVVVVGAGPAGLAAAVYAAAEGIDALVVEGESIGGQAGSSSRIRNYLGFSRGVSGAELAQRAYQQAWVFGAQFLLMSTVTALRPDHDGHAVVLADGTEIEARAVVLAMGVSYRRLGIPALEDLLGAGVFYGASTSEAQACTERDIYVIGGGNSAGQAALFLARYARRVTIVVRSGSLADSMSQYLRQEIDAAPHVSIVFDTQVVDGGGAGRLEWIRLRTADGGERDVPASALFVLIGADPRTEWLPEEIERDEHGFVRTGVDLEHVASGTGTWPLERPPQAFETSVPGVFAVGDVRASAIKRVASAVGEGSNVIQQVTRHIAEVAVRSAP